MNPSFNTPFRDQRVTQDRRSRPTSFLSIFKYGGRRKNFRRDGEERNQYVDRPSPRTIVVTFMIFILSTLDAVFTTIHLENGGFELNPVMGQIIRSGFQSVMIIKSPGIGLIACFLAAHQNFRIGLYGMHVSAAIYIALSAYHVACIYLFQGI